MLDQRKHRHYIKPQHSKSCATILVVCVIFTPTFRHLENNSLKWKQEQKLWKQG